MLTPEQVAEFHSTGFLVMRGVVTGPELDLLREVTSEIIARGIARDGDDHRYLPGPSGSDVYWRSERMWDRHPVFRSVTVHPAILEAVGQCVGDTFYPWNDSLVVKLPENGAEVRWHQDPPYDQPDRAGTFSVPNFTTDIYLDASTIENGCVWGLAGRHLEGHVPLAGVTHDEFVAHHQARPMLMEPGDVMFHALSAPHGSPPNRSGHLRRIFYVHYLNQRVYDDGYAALDWAREKPGWSPARKAAIDRMCADRNAYGHGDPRRHGSLLFGDDGIRLADPVQRVDWSARS